MDTTSVRHGTTARLNEARELLRHITAAEQAAGPLQPLPPFESSLRGLFYVQAYGALEHCVNALVQQYLAFVVQTGVRQCHLKTAFNTIALDPELTSLAMRGDKKKWQVRRELFEKMISNTPAACNDSVFGVFLQNIWPQTIEEVLKCFGIDARPTREVRHVGYLNELVEKRNAVAHGRMTSTEAGEGKSSADLNSVFSAVADVCTYLVSTMEEHASNLGFIRDADRRLYRTA